MVVAGTLVGLIGARIYFILETPRALRSGLFSSFLEPTGLSWLGGLIAGTGASCFFSFAYKIPLLTILDLAAPIGALVYGTGRVGCLLAGDGDYGSPTSLPWGMAFPRGIVPTFEPVHPTPVYEALFSAVLFLFLWRLGSKARLPGVVAGAYLVLSGAARFLVEFIKLNPRVYWGLTNSQVLSLVSVIAGAALLASPWLNRRDELSGHIDGIPNSKAGPCSESSSKLRTES
jgi:phosphatidylglycerol:prolipoprotein diacylglycerol transferase